MMGFLGRFIINTIAFLAISKLMPGFKIKKDSTVFSISIVYGILMAIGHYLVGVGFTLGFFSSLFLGPLAPFAWLIMLGIYLVIGFALSVAVLMLTDHVLDDLAMDSTATAVVAAAILAVLQMILSKIF
jgi:uncharacterized membrane protein YvlD (DUF360 family)